MTSSAEQLKLWAAGDCSYFGLLKSAPKATVARNADGKKGPTAQKHRTPRAVQHQGAIPSTRVEDARRGEDVCMQKLELPSRRKISAMAAGHDHAIICCADQTLLSTGSNYFGQLGNGVDGMSQKAFSQLEIRLPIVSVACGASHTVMATLYGEMYSCGNNTSGQLGLGDFQGRLVLTRSDLSDSSVISVAAGMNDLVSLTRSVFLSLPTLLLFSI
jgi:alpha-tubulin suppressor-like RCC1 family protein